MRQTILLSIPKDELELLIIDCVNSCLQSKKKESSQSENGLLTIQEASDFLSLKVPTLYQKVSKREICFLKRSKRLYFKREDLIEYLEKGRVKSVSEIQEEAENFFKKKGVQNG
jgi:excisionase family DNA binding protein